MKKIVFSIMLTIIGLIFSAFCFMYASLNPWDYNGVTGLMGSFLGTNMLMPFIISLIVMISGLVISWYEAYKRK